MANRIPRKCLENSCHEVGDFHATIGRCPEHAHKVNAERGRARRGDRKYNVAEDDFREAILAQNPFCQRVIEGVRCRYPAVIIHHLITVREREDLKFHQSNVVMCCRNHHPRPTDPDQGQFTPTIYALLGVVLEADHGVEPGWSVPRELKLWSREERVAFFAKEAEANVS